MRAIQSDHHATIQLLKEEITSPASKQKPAPVSLLSSQIPSLARLEYGLASPIPLVLSSHQSDSTAGASASAGAIANAYASAGASASESYLSPLPGHYQPMEQSMPPLSTEVLSSPQSPPPPPPSSPPPLPSPAIVGESNFHHYYNLINLVNHNYQTP